VVPCSFTDTRDREAATEYVQSSASLCLAPQSFGGEAP